MSAWPKLLAPHNEADSLYERQLFEARENQAAFEAIYPNYATEHESEALRLKVKKFKLECQMATTAEYLKAARMQGLQSLEEKNLLFAQIEQELAKASKLPPERAQIVREICSRMLTDFEHALWRQHSLEKTASGSEQNKAA